VSNAQRHVSHGLLCEEARRRMASAGGDFNWSERGASATGKELAGLVAPPACGYHFILGSLATQRSRKSRPDGQNL
jgi:hypothetical protein